MRSILAFVFLLLASHAESAIIYVNPQMQASGDGLSWETAYGTLRDAIATASPYDEIWVAGGNHSPGFGDPNDGGFLLVEGLKIFGGFNGTETSRNQRDWMLNPSYLTGNPGVLNQEDYYRTLFNLAGVDIVIDGFIIHNTYSETLGADFTTAGVFKAVQPNNVDATIVHCILRGNISGYSAIAWNFVGDLQFKDCVFENNVSGNNHLIEVGAGNNLRIENCTFSNNTASGLDVGVAGNAGGLPTVEIYNSIVFGNSMPLSLPSYVSGSHVLLDIPYNGTNISNIISGDPLFANSSDPRLKKGSPAIDSGDISFVTTGRDMGGLARIYGTSVDLGAFEKHSKGTVFVKLDASGANDGTSWENAYADLHTALASVFEEDSIWMAEGTYRPHLTDQNISFVMPVGVSVFGGFVGNENELAQRDWRSNKTILSGNIGNANDSTDNSFHVVQLSQQRLDHPYQVTLDGLVIQDGYAFDPNGPILPDQDVISGAGLNFKGTSYSQNYTSNLTINVVNCTVRNNHAWSDGGGALIVSNLNMVNSTFLNNSSNNGGALKVDYALYIEGSLFVNNRSENDVLALYGDDIEIVNCTFIDNISSDPVINPNSGHIIDANGPSALRNCLFYNNVVLSTYFFGYSTTTENCILQSEYVQPALVIDCILEIPTFISASNSDYRLCLSSVGIDAGASLPLLSSSDLNGDSRLMGGTIDIGAYETDPSYRKRIYVDKDATGNNNGKNWTDAFTDLHSALESVDCMAEIWISDGLYKPTSGSDRDIAFIVPSDTRIYGGFNATETARSQRNWALNKTIISGAIGNLLDITDNSKKLVHIEKAGNEVLLDGIEFRRAYSTENDGYSGGAIFSQQGNVTLRHCEFNLNTGFGASALSVSNGNSVIDYCLFFDNHVAEGGQITGRTGTVNLEVKNCTFSKNSHDDLSGHEVHVFSGSSAQVYNTIFWGNVNFLNTAVPELHHCIVQGGGEGEFVFNLDPMFTNTDLNDFSLLPESPGIDIGFPSNTEKDLAYNSTQQGLLTDLGCFESSLCSAVNDDCANLIVLSVDQAPVFSTNKCSTASNDQPLSCSQGTGNSVWYGFSAPEEGAVRIIVDNIIPISDNFNVKIGLFDNNCNSLEEISCENANGSGMSETLEVIGVQPGTPFRIRVEGTDQQIGFYNIRIESTNVGCLADFNDDGSFSTVDLLMIISEIGCGAGCFTDINNDGSVSIADLLTFFSYFGGQCE